jgi:flavin-dependent dehydrogenase
VTGATVERAGVRSEIRCRLLIGADGARSSVARRVGASFEHRAASCSATMYAFVPGLPDNVYRNIFRPSMAAGVIPTNDGQANVWVAVGRQRFDREARRDVVEYFHRQLERADPALATHVARDRTSRIHSFPGLAGFTRQAWGPGWALVGDAVYFKDPVSAHGMTDALSGAELLARHVVRMFRGAAESAALARYATVRASLADPMMDAVAFLATYSWAPSEVKHAHLAMNQAMRDEWNDLRTLDRSEASVSTGRVA